MTPNPLLAALTVAAASLLARPSEPPALVIRDVTVIDGNGTPGRPGQTVVIRDGRIAALGPAGSVRVPAGSRVLDGRGRWLIPGLIDMHAHVTLGPVTGVATGALRMTLDTSVASRSLASLLAAGVTTIRDPGTASAGLAVAIRDSVARGELAGPRMFVAGPVIDASNFEGLVEPAMTPDQVAAAVRRHAAAGVDYVKLYASLPPPAVAAGIRAAHESGVKALAHLLMTPWTEAAEAGIDGIVHSVPGSPRLLPPAHRQAFLAGMARSARFMFQWFEYYDPASAEADSMISALVRSRVVHDPTLVVFEAMAWGDDPRITAHPDLALASPALLANWRTEFTLSAGFTPASFDSSRAVWPAMLRFVRQLHERGVFLVAGTDANNPWVVPGPSLHRELELLAEAGIPPAEVIRIATRNGAEALGIAGEVGTIRIGRRADLVLLDGDPLASISNTRRIAAVIQAGRVVAGRP
jgi:imidazolonepropionase-like amidohydrolase